MTTDTTRTPDEMFISMVNQMIETVRLQASLPATQLMTGNQALNALAENMTATRDSLIAKYKMKVK